ncbi:MAG: SDR family oxidoreductase, partial [Caulobacterales bacterium]|nr:SDR family oxidoreductase [Caulobacterales bacterium]
MTHSVLITGCNGDIGKTLVSAFDGAGWRVVGVDKTPAGPESVLERFIQTDIGEFLSDPEALSRFAARTRDFAGERPLRCLVNNAAVQYLAPLQDLEVSAV